MALNTTQLENDIKTGVSAVPLDGSVVVSDEIAKVVAEAVRDYLTPFVTAYNSHIHITTATVAATPTPGVLSTTTSQV